MQLVKPQLRVGFILQPQFTLIAYSCFVDVLRHAADESDRSRQILCSWKIIGDTDRTLPASCGMEIRPDVQLQAVEPSEFDYIVVVGGLLSAASQIDPAVYPFIRGARGNGVGIVGLCSGVFHLARAGLLAGCRVAVPGMYAMRFAREHPEAIGLVDQAFSEDSGIFTSLGGVASLELAISLIDRHCGPRRAQKCLDRLCVDATFAARRVQQSAAERFALAGDRHLERAVAVMRRQGEKRLSIERVAAEVGITDRQLRNIFRRHTGLPPARFWREMQLREARWLLVNTSESITQIAFATGFADAGHLGRDFRRTFGETPSAYRSSRTRADISRMSE